MIRRVLAARPASQSGRGPADNARVQPSGRDRPEVADAATDTRAGRRISVAVLSSSFPLGPEYPGGVFVQKLVQALVPAVRIRVLVPATATKHLPAPDEPYELRLFRYAPPGLQRLAHEPGGIPVALKRNSWLYLVVPLYLLAMFYQCLRMSRRVDLIHANWSVNGFVAGIAGWLSGVPVVTTLRGTDLSSVPRSAIMRFFVYACLRTSRATVTVGSDMQQRLVKVFPRYRDRVMTIPNGVDDEFLQISRPRDSGQGVDVLAVGNLVPNKAMDLIIRAVAALEDPGLRLNIVGDGTEKLGLRALAGRLAVTERVHLAGPVPHCLINTVYRDADIFVLASYSEGRPNVLVEAMASGVAIIASRIDGVTELIEHDRTGLLFDPGDSEQLATCIRLLRDEPERRHRLGAAARRFVTDNSLLWSQTADRYLQLYQSILKAR